MKILKQANQTVPDFLSSGGGDDSGWKSNEFGGQDMRQRNVTPAAHGGGAEDEEW